MRIPLVGIVLLLSLVTAKGDVIEDRMAVRIKLLLDPARGPADFVKTLRENVRLIDGVLIVDEPLAFGISALSPNSPWVIKCGVGMEVLFGTAVSFESGDVHSDVKLTLA